MKNVGGIVEYRDDKHGPLVLDFLSNLIFKRFLWWCSACRRFHAGRRGEKMECPFGKDKIEKDKE